jgi:hypothetical protein
MEGVRTEDVGGRFEPHAVRPPLSPDTSTWNTIEHRLFRFITQNWRGKPLISHQAIVNLTANTRTRAGLLVKAALDTRHDETAKQLSDADCARVRLTPHDFHGTWHATISPRRSSSPAISAFTLSTSSS